MQIAEIIDLTEVEGPSLRTAIWFQGCSINCLNCCNQEYIPKIGGITLSVNQVFEKIAKNPVEGITILGGEPLDQASELYQLIKMLKEKLNWGIMLFTGYTYENILKNPDKKRVFDICDLVISEPFVQKHLAFDRRWIGSSNQRVHFVTDRYKYLENTWEPYYKEIEFHIKDGEIVINGMPIESGIL